MRSKRPFVIVTRKLPDPVETRMMELFACRLNLDDKPLGKPELIAAVAQADVLVPTVTDRIDADVVASAGPALKLIASFGAGVDHVDLAARHHRDQHARGADRGHRGHDDGLDPRGLAPSR
jgi:glyoxylate reductase